MAALPFEVREEVAQLTPELIQSGRWKDVELRRYDVKAFAPTSTGGKKHPMTILIEKVRDAFLTMGFTEIRGQYVESAFWNMDALFTAQDHPARELHDTFYLDNPSRIDLSEDKELCRLLVAEEHRVPGLALRLEPRGGAEGPAEDTHDREHGPAHTQGPWAPLQGVLHREDIQERGDGLDASA